MSVRRTVCEWSGIEFLPVVTQLVEEKLCAGEGSRPLDPDVVNVKALYQRWCHSKDINPRQQSMLQALSNSLNQLDMKRSALA